MKTNFEILAIPDQTLTITQTIYLLLLGILDFLHRFASQVFTQEGEHYTRWNLDQGKVLAYQNANCMINFCKQYSNCASR